MSTPGLSLVGFMADQQAAFRHLRTECVPPDASDAALSAEWNAARTSLGPAIANAGNPNIQQLAGADAQYAQALSQLPWVAAAFQQFQYQNVNFQLIEIDPILAYQFTVSLERSGHHCNHLNNPQVTDLLPICLPQTQPMPEYLSSPLTQDSKSVIFKARNLNVRPLGPGVFNLTVNGYQITVPGFPFHVALPFAHVLRFNNRYYLHNGFHRALGIRRAGATHMPCILRDVQRAEDVGIRTDDTTFPLDLLESANPPTVGHFTQGRSHAVELRAHSRILHVSWAEYVMPDEYERMTP